MALFAVLAPALAAASELSGRVVGVADGDTLTLLHAQTPVRIRLAEIDAPEKAQPFGQRSKQSLSDLCYGKEALVVVSAQDRYGRSIGRVWCAGTDANAEQVRRGMAWVYDRYATDKTLYSLQDAARQARNGLWADPAPVRPWNGAGFLIPTTRTCGFFPFGLRSPISQHSQPLLAVPAATLDTPLPARQPQPTSRRPLACGACHRSSAAVRARISASRQHCNDRHQ
ncbi:thermonuclease family protein [Aeromonas veronii]|uniref:thermonuclease family protein n=1 Tax=Aeromonas veronii TaxID=654 RepID=UPI0030EF805D